MSDPYFNDPEKMAAEAEAEARKRADGEEPKNDIEAEIERLLKLSHLEYQRVRKDAAKKIGISADALDFEIKQRRKKREQDEPAAALFEHWNIEPWPDPVNTRELLLATTAQIEKYVVLRKPQLYAAALWIMFTWLHDLATHSPILLVTSPEAICGKSTLFGILGFMVRRALLTINITGAALFRSIEKWHPSFVIDEADDAFANNSDLREVVNSGWTRGQCAIRCDPVTFEPAAFSTFSPKAVGGLMKGQALPSTTLSRSIVVELRRKLPGETVADFSHVDEAEPIEIRRKLQRWADDHGARIAGAAVTVPAGFHNRMRANWKLLLAIAEDAGSGKEACAAAISIEQGKTASFEGSLGVELLSDVRKAFGDREAIFTKDLIGRLVADEERPWLSYGKAHKPITDRQLARLLKAFTVLSSTVWIDGASAKGYRRADFADTWGRYLGDPDAQPDASDVSDVHPDAQPDAQEGQKTHENGGSDAWTAGGIPPVYREGKSGVCAQCGAGDGVMHERYGALLHEVCAPVFLREQAEEANDEANDPPF